ncbi:MAG: EAL domain-containing protein [Lachnospiraceae bacterium]|nr:EAL domain-containing protein [Lachnospiraceae bacterium]
MTKQEYIDGFEKALREQHIYAVYQPQINHATGRCIGAEALMRWKDPESGVQYPSDFIPVLEESGLIFRADLYMFERACLLQKTCMEKGITPLPISVNMSRYDIIGHDFPQEIEQIRKRLAVPVRLLRIEITESSAIGGMDRINEILKQLHSYGYVVEMDDFGSGYSSLNVLKDLDIDVIKLDMRFLSGNIGGRGGIIINSMVQMSKWLHTPVIAEGVETMEQADYMKSIGCNYIQGYLYSRPVPEEEYLKMISERDHEPVKAAMKLVETMDAGKFWDTDSMETLIFSNYVGGAAIFTYQNGKLELLRVNAKYVKEIGMNISEKEFLRSDPWRYMNLENHKLYDKTIQKAIASGEEESCETWREFSSDCCGDDRICIRTSLRVIGRAGEQYLFYAMIQNVTAEKKRYMELFSSEQRFRHASEQVNIYAWEYDIATKEMRPCFRCMRDLGLPPLVRNYPEPAIEAGIFPPDYADMYRDWHRQLEEGVEHLEAVIPLTVGRVPFRVRYSLEYDENHKPLKAYGSAALVCENE